MDISKEVFEKRFGFMPENDDLDRVNCDEAGMPGHSQCGVCPEHKKPRFQCGCLRHANEPNHEHDPDLADPSDLDKYAARIGSLRIDAMFEESSNGLGPVAEQHLCLALSLLEQAAHHVKLASLHQASALADRRLR